MKEIDSRVDVRLLVHSFYAKIRKDDLLGPIFNGHIPDQAWPAHLEKLTDFWETNLFGIAKFKGNPAARHATVDANLEHSIDQVHFGKWLQLWFETIDELFEGDRALKAKQSARKMSTGLFLAIWNNRPKEKNSI